MIALASSALLKMAYSSLIAGVGVSVVVSLAVLGTIRANDSRRTGRTGAATAYAALAVTGLVLSVAIVIYGLIVVSHKS